MGNMDVTHFFIAQTQTGSVQPDILTTPASSELNPRHSRILSYSSLHVSIAISNCYQSIRP